MFKQHTPPRTQPIVDGRLANGRWCTTSHSFRDLIPFSSSSLSLSFQIFNSSIDGAVPTIPGCVKPGNLTPAVHIYKYVGSENYTTMCLFNRLNTILGWRVKIKKERKRK